MALFSEIISLGRSFVKQFLGKEANFIPLSGLTLEAKHRKMAKQALSWTENQYTDLSKIERYENAFATFINQKSTTSFASGREALSAILEALELQALDKVMVCGFSCVAVANSVVFLGAEPVFYDIELDTFGSDFLDIKKKFEANSDIKGIIIQYSFGMICKDVEKICDWAKEQNIWIVEDACLSLGAKRNGMQAGSFGDAAFFSTERSKCISTFQGGVAVSRHDELNKKIKELQHRSPFQDKQTVQHLLRQFIFTYNIQRDNSRWYKRLPLMIQQRRDYIPGNHPDELLQKQPPQYGRRLSAPMADIGWSQLQKLGYWNEVRRQKASEWKFWATSRGFLVPKLSEIDEATFLRYPILVSPEEKQDLRWSRGLEIEVGVWYVSHLHPIDTKVENCPNADEAIRRCVNLPTNLAYKA